MHPILADITLNGDGDPTSGPVAPGLIAFLIIVVLGLVLWFLLKNMGKQLRRANTHFEAEEAREAALAGGLKVDAVPEQGEN